MKDFLGIIGWYQETFGDLKLV
ncbi:hypothetical protein NE061598_10070 [Francisella tularensis subsp. tularensis NE061598]|nr:hypothetical protein NE061598_10070 [Francisella tularensis subsp. tularensis NE061598]